MNGRSASSAYQSSDFDRTIRWSSGADFTFTSIEQHFANEASAADILRAASDPEAIQRVSQHALTMFVEGVGGSGKTDNLLYIIREADHSRSCKIGYACKPTERLAGLQCGTWRELKIEAVFCPVRASIEKLERAVHLAARRRDLSIRGEWISATPLEATALIIEFARKKGYALCGPDVFLDNLGARVAGLRKQQLEHRAKFAA